MGCKIIQGYYVAQPKAVADLDPWLKKQSILLRFQHGFSFNW
jgi:EAL domain-containing protein (putative c-di-GMP-specific phosphodiesterase class I)